MNQQGSNTKERLKQFITFHHYLMQTAPKDYTPHYFTCQQNGKNPDGRPIWSRAKKNCLRCNQEWSEYEVIQNEQKKTKKKCNNCGATPGGWKEPHAKLSYEETKKAIKQGYNIGLGAMAHDKLVLIDIDSEKILTEVPSDSLADTSRKRAGSHIFCYAKDKKLIHNYPFGFGEIRANDQYVLIPGSYVPFTKEDLESEISNGDIEPETAKKIRNDEYRGYYTVRNECPPKHIEYEDIPETFRKAIEEHKIKQEQAKKRAEKQEAELRKKRAQRNKRSGKDELEQLFEIKVSDLTTNVGSTQRVGHPLHSSDTNANWSMSDDGSLGMCWRHNVSLNGYQYLLVESGYASCQDAGTPHHGGTSNLAGDKQAVIHAINYALKQGLIVPREETIPKNKQETKETGNEAETTTHKRKPKKHAKFERNIFTLGKKRIKIEDLATRRYGFKLENEGMYYTTNCPHHTDNEVRIFPGSNVFKCEKTGCEFKGDIIEFIRQMEVIK